MKYRVLIQKVFFTFLVMNMGLSCIRSSKNEASYYELEKRCKNLGDYQAYLELAHANLLSNYDILSTSIFVSRKYNWEFAHYNVYLSLKPYFDDNQNKDSALINFAIYHLDKSVELNYPQGIYDKSILLREGRIVVKDTVLANELLLKYNKLIDGLKSE
jgi:hypothetical protein